MQGSWARLGQYRLYLLQWESESGRPLERDLFVKPRQDLSSEFADAGRLVDDRNRLKTLMPWQPLVGGERFIQTFQMYHAEV